MSEICFRDLESTSERIAGAERAKSGRPLTGLEVWYEAARVKPIADLSVDDLCRACRQNIYLEHVVPAALLVLQQDVTAGHQYDYELAFALARISREFWKTHIKMAKQIAKSLEKAREKLESEIVELENRSGLEAVSELDMDIRSKIEIFLSQVKEQSP